MIAVALLALLTLQSALPDSVPVTGEPSLHAVFHGRREHYIHLTLLHPDSLPRGFDRGDSLGTIDDRPARLSRRHHDTIIHARGLYAQGRYAEAAALLAPAYKNEPDNRFLMEDYARTLYRIDERRDESFAVYTKLVAALDRAYDTGDSTVAVDLWFLESYWKLGTLLLDRGEWERAAFEITRSASLFRPEDERFEQVLTFLAEAYVHLDRPDLARWSAQQALRINPRNAEALEYLYQLGPAARRWGSTHVFACRFMTDTLPCLGGYSFHRHPAAGVVCVSPREDPPTPLSPCLRLGWVHVGQARTEVEQILGGPFQALPRGRDGTDVYAYLVYSDSVRDRASYYVVEYEQADGVPVARTIQLTGDSIPLPLDFSGLLLGDASERVLRQLGPPTTRGEFNDQGQNIKGEWWDWSTAAISVEIVGGRLYSVRLWRPDGVPAHAIKRTFSRFR
jgi:hypothetical protein